MIALTPLGAEENSEELAMQLANPIASLISLPLQLNYDEGFGSEDDGQRFLLNVQPVIPLSLSENWNLITRTIVPLVDQKDIFPGAGGQSGVGDVVQSLFFSPARPTKSGLVWGIGPVFLLPTGSDDLLTADQWGAGPTVVALRQNGPKTLGMLFNHIESISSSDRPDVSASFIQPFLSRTTPSAATFSFNFEATYDWEGEAWSVPVNLAATKVQRWGNQLVSLGGGLRYWIETPDSGPEGLGARLILTFLFPK
jgi:hypothetical protein